MNLGVFEFSHDRLRFQEAVNLDSGGDHDLLGARSHRIDKYLLDVLARMTINHSKASSSESTDSTPSLESQGD